MKSLRTQVLVLLNKLTIMEPTHCIIKLEQFWELKPTICLFPSTLPFSNTDNANVNKHYNNPEGGDGGRGNSIS